MRNIAVVVEYDGTDFSGFAAQPGQRTVQGVIEIALERILGCPTGLTGAGRTDAGAHARGQTVNFLTEVRIPVERVAAILNRTLPNDIAVRRAWEAPPEWSARFSAHSRTYRYSILNREQPSPFIGRFAMREPRPLDEARMHQAAQALLGRHDFTLFTLEMPGTRYFEREVFATGVRRTGQIVRFHIEGTAFLRGMVRLIAGALIEIGVGKQPVGALAAMLDNPAGARATRVAPACGLCLMKVTYKGSRLTRGMANRSGGSTLEDGEEE